MKPSPFEYLKASTLNEAKALLAQYGDGCKILAGGQTLVPMMNYRLANPEVLIDINDVSGLDHIVADQEGLTLGALVRWSQIASSPDVAQANPLLAEAVRHIAHYQIRNRGTWAGSCAHADPAAEFPAVAIACDAKFLIESPTGQKTVSAEEFFLAPLTTVLEASDLLVEVRFPPWPRSRRWAFEEFAFRSGDFAIAGVLAVIDTVDGKNVCRLVSFGMGGVQKRASSAEAVIASEGLNRSAFERAARAAADEAETQDDTQAPADYRRALLETLTYRALCSAADLEDDQ